MEDFFQWAQQFPNIFDLTELAWAEAWLTALQTDRRRKQPA
jgi:hypothetical protein